MRISPSATCIASALMAVAAVAGCSSGGQPATARSTPASSGQPATDWQCPQSSTTGWPNTNHVGAQDMLVPESPATGYKCVYSGPASNPTLVGSTDKLTPAEIDAIASRFNTAPPMWSHSCPGPLTLDPEIKFEKYYFTYSDQTAVVIELGRFNCPPSITNGQATRAISPPPSGSSAPAAP